MNNNLVKLRKKNPRRTIAASASLLAFCVLGGLVFGIIERVRDAADRAH